MKRLTIFCLLLLAAPAFAQSKPAADTIRQHIAAVPGSPGSATRRVELSSDVDASWYRWKERGYSFGFDPTLTPMYSTVNGILSTPYMVQVRGNGSLAAEKNKKRWGYHVFEGYAADDKSRITMLVNKHVEQDKPVAELYYYGTTAPAARLQPHRAGLQLVQDRLRRAATFVYVQPRPGHLLWFAPTH